MDTVEELNSTYFYAGRSNLTASQLLFMKSVSQKRYSSGAGFHYRYAHCVCQGWSLVV